MSPLSDIGNAAIGWLDLIGRRPAGAERFNATRTGLVTMLVTFFVLLVATRSVQSLVVYGGLPGPTDLAISVILGALSMAAVGLLMLLTVRFLQPATGILALMVPAGYALSALTVGLGFALYSSAVYWLVHGVFGYMLYRLGRDIGKFGIGVSVAFAVLGVLMLVAIPIGLYMLFVPDLPTPD